uniref:Uncharacterized protein n=1 Tax=Bionectria ochroleuca TaxID=29856 RepID=A0A0B7K5T2_BIOOC
MTGATASLKDFVIPKRGPKILIFKVNQ